MSEYSYVTKTVPTFYFVGVSTSKSSIMKIFPHWMEALGRPEVVIEGIDHKIHDNPEAYRRTVAHIKSDPLSLGGLVTTHKIDLLEAARDLFDELHSSARLTNEVSCISKRGEQLWGHAVDPLTSGLSLKAFLPAGYFGRTGGQVLCFGAGGSGKAICLHWINQADKADRPEKIIVVNRSQGRLDDLRGMIDSLESDIQFEMVCNADPLVNDRLMESLPEYSLVINATGMGKDTPGSPITDAGRFPRQGIAWEFNYRGELDFWRQAMAQKDSREVQVEDGWIYFLHGWTQVIAEVLHLELDQATFAKLAALAETLHTPLVYQPRT